MAAAVFFQLVNARYLRGAIIVTSNRSFNEWSEIFRDAVPGPRPESGLKPQWPSREPTFGLELPVLI